VPDGAALKAFGNPADVMEDVREVSMWIWWERLAQDLRYGQAARSAAEARPGGLEPLFSSSRCPTPARLPASDVSESL
jgi:hypothetical protein